MIEKLTIENFKIFGKKTSFDNLRPFTILTGINGRGKSSMVQPLVAVAQTIRATRGVDTLCLNGEMVELGTALDVKNEDSSRDNLTIFSIGFKKGRTLTMAYSFDDEKASFLSMQKMSADRTEFEFHSPYILKVPELKPLSKLLFISADRVPPRLGYKSSNDTRYVGSKGEYAVCAFHHHKNNEINIEFFNCLPDIYSEVVVEDLDRTFLGLMQFWMEKMFKPTRIDTDYIAETNEYALKISNLDRHGKFKPTNVGFGYSYVFPILVAGLLAEAGDILIIENPEAHLHPAAQSALGKFLVWITLKDVQVIVETHSEHILNAPRVLIVQEAFDSEDLAVLYFDEKYEKGYTPVKVLDTGRIKDWPDGFFDQLEKDNDLILGI